MLAHDAEVQALGDRDITVLVAVSPALVAELITDRLDREPGIVVTRTVCTAPDLAGAAPTAHQDVVCVDPRLITTSMSDFARDLGSMEPNLVVLASSTSDLLVLDAVRAGCSSFASTDQTADQLVTAVRAAYAGEPHMDEALLERFARQIDGPAPSGPSATLTEREREILVLCAEGLSARQVADRIGLSVNTVRHHIQSVLTKLGVHSKLEAVSAAVRNGIIPPRI